MSITIARGIRAHRGTPRALAGLLVVAFAACCPVLFATMGVDVDDEATCHVPVGTPDGEHQPSSVPCVMDMAALAEGGTASLVHDAARLFDDIGFPALVPYGELHLNWRTRLKAIGLRPVGPPLYTRDRKSVV